MLNGALTIGTMDGANVEIAELVGEDNIFIFGRTSDDIIERYAKADYVSKDYYNNDPEIKAAVDFIVGDEMMAVGSKEHLERLYNELLNKDWFMTLIDFADYKEKREAVYAAYADKKAWSKMALKNIANAGFFSSDRTIEEYNRDIWKVEKQNSL